MRPCIAFEEKTGCIPVTAGQILTGLLGAGIRVLSQTEEPCGDSPGDLRTSCFKNIVV